MSNVNKYWKDYKNKFKTKWHFDPFSKQQDYQYVGRLKTNYNEIDNLISKLEKTTKVEAAVEKNPKIKNKKVISKINSYLSWGYTNENTKFYRAFSKDHEKIFKKFIEVTKLEMAVSSIIKQFPGQSIPWHMDNYFTFVKSIEDKGIKINKKKIVRYMIFLSDWDYGHFFSVGSSIVNKWKKGDIITWYPYMHHCGCNGGMKPKITMNITGIYNSSSLHKIGKKLFSI